MLEHSHLNEFGDKSHLSGVAVFLTTTLFKNVKIGKDQLGFVSITAISLVS